LANDPMFWTSLGLTVLIAVCVLALTLGGGVLLAILLDQDFPGRSIARCLAIAPFFVMPTVSALVWKHLLMHPVYGVFARINEVFGLRPIDWFSSHPLLSLIMILTWEWLPFALLILLTALQSLDREQLEAAQMDGAGLLQRFRFILLPHLGRAIGVVALMEILFLLGLFAEIFVTTSGGPGTATTNLPYFIYIRALLQFDIGGASAGAVAAVVLANLGAAVLARFALAKETA
jgi:sorbitol/mannitol transport system permease protein